MSDFRTMRRKRQQLSEDESISILQQARPGVKASFCVIAQDDIQPKKYTTYYRSVIAFGRIHIIEDESEKLETARLLGNRYNPNDEESLQKELEHGYARMLMIRFDIEHLTGKEAIELEREHSV